MSTTTYEVGDQIQILMHDGTWLPATCLGITKSGLIKFIFNNTGKEATCSTHYVRKKLYVATNA
jgi:hypothetical protein